MPVPGLTVVEFIDGVRAGLQLGELPGEVGVPDVGGVLVHGGAAFVFGNDATDSKPEYCEKSEKFADLIGRRLKGFLGLSLNDRTILFLVMLLYKTVSGG